MEPSAIKTVPANVAYCRGRVCHSFADCDIDGACKYEPSGAAFVASRMDFVEECRCLCGHVESAHPQRGECKHRATGECGCPKYRSNTGALQKTTLPVDSDERKDIPLARGCFDYFPAAFAEIARLSKAGNDKHNPGEDLHWARGKSMDHADCILRHLAERGVVDTDGFLHDVKVAWRALAQLQEALELRGAPKARGAR